MRIPFCPIPVKTAKKLLGSTFYGIVEPILKLFPNLDMELEQADFDLSDRDYISITVFSGLFMFLLTYFSFFLITSRVIEMQKSLSMSFFLGMVFFLVTFFYIKSYPKLIIKKRMLDLERNMPYALRHMYVQVTSGVPVFDAIVSVSDGNYGAVSTEFRRAIKAINTGISVEKALDNIALRNPSQYFRRSIWQVANGIKTGSDIGGILRNIIDYISSEQKIAIRRYGSQLNPMTLVYMMIAVIIPSLGITFLMVLSSFSNIPISETMFWGILIFLAFFQFMFLGIIKSKRPNII
ncbi:MAG: type II secretion system F family protein [Candidatus Aenigmarchaeota archaeon]|nr:type II secretion system F family protein [Candidatus Aenigmarchaeota archaeon]